MLHIYIYSSTNPSSTKQVHTTNLKHGIFCGFIGSVTISGWLSGCFVVVLLLHFPINRGKKVSGCHLFF